MTRTEIKNFADHVISLVMDTVEDEHMTDSEYTFLCEYLAQHYTQQFNAYKEEG